MDIGEILVPLLRRQARVDDDLRVPVVLALLGRAEEVVERPPFTKNSTRRSPSLFNALISLPSSAIFFVSQAESQAILARSPLCSSLVSAELRSMRSSSSIGCEASAVYCTSSRNR